MGNPILAQNSQHRFGQWYIAVFASFSMTDMHQLARSIDMAHLQMQPFLQA